MTITIPIGGLTRCAGGGHIFLQFSVNAGPMRMAVLNRDALLEDTDDPDCQRSVLVARLMAELKEHDLTTWAQIKAGLEDKTFKV